MKEKKKVKKKKIFQAVADSSKKEGLSLARAKKDKKTIQLLKEYGRAFAVLR